MEQYIMKGGNPLVGEVTISGAKNAALGILAAAIMTDDDVVIDNLPDVSDINALLEAISHLGAKVERIDRHTVKINAENIHAVTVEDEHMRKIRASYYFIGALLGKYKSAEVPLPGGCTIGSRPIDQHLKGFRALGSDVKIARALISVTDKTGVVDFARTLVDDFGVEIISTGGTARAIEDAGVPVTPIEEFTGYPEMMDGRVKTLHPKVHGALLARRDSEQHMQEAAQHGIKLIDLVVVNLYEFEKTVANPEVTFADAIEHIDIGGPSMLRSAAKNATSVTVISDPVQRAVDRYKSMNNGDVKNIYKKVTFQLNDTHPTVAVAELMRILMDENGLEWDEAWDITTKTVAYTNHTIMAEALEKWPIELFSRLLPRIYQIVEEINRRFVEEIKAKYPGNQEKVRKMAIIYDGQVKMANLAIVAGYSVNGVAKLHTEILKKQELRDFYEMMPEKFNNKTNGITQRRFLKHANPLLSDWITDKIGDGWVTDLSQLEKLMLYVDDPKAQQDFMQIKYKNKVRLAKYIKENNGIDVDPNSIFDVQVKRLHEYKRQLLNILHVMYLYNQIKRNPDYDMVPRTFIFGAKAAAGYKIAKQTIKLINNVANVINNDASIKGKIKVVFIENYRVSNGEIIFAAADVSEQISTASKEASGTGNMKFMLNGAITLGTMDGANVEIVNEVGAENAQIFGLSSDEVIRFENEGGYDPMEIFNNDQEIRDVLMELINGKYSPEDTEMFRDIYNSLLNNDGGRRADTYFILKDFRSYAEAQRKIDERYRDTNGWAKTVMTNTAKAGKFSSDRTIEEYATEIWKLTKTPVEM